MRHPGPSLVTMLISAISLALIAGGSPAPVAAQGPVLQPVTATLDRTEAKVGESLLLTVNVVSGQAEHPRLPPLDAFDTQLVGRGVQTLEQGGARLTVQSFRYSLVARRPGEHRIGPITVPVNGAVFQSRPIVVRIHGSEAHGERDAALRVWVEASEREPFVGQQVLYTWRFEHRIHVGDPRLSSYDYGDFLGEDLGPIRDIRTRADGRESMIRELRRALFPQKAGRVALGGPDVSCEVTLERRADRRDPWSEIAGSLLTETKTLRPQPLVLRVRPLPPPPPDFSGLVGQLVLEARLTKEKLALGDSTMLEISIEGDANARRIPEPNPLELPGIKIYDDKALLGIERGPEGLRSRKTFRRLLVPLEAGEFVVPPVRLTHFDPVAERYRTLETPPLALSVSPAGPSPSTPPPLPSPSAGQAHPSETPTDETAPSAGSAASDAARTREPSGEDAAAGDGIPAAAPASPSHNANDESALGRRLGAGLLAAAVAAAIGLWALRRYRAGQPKRQARAVRREALSAALTAIDEAARELERGETVAAANRLRDASAAFLRARAGLSTSALCGNEPALELARLDGADVETCRRLGELLDSLEACRYGGVPLASMVPGELAGILREIDARLVS